MTDAMLFLIGLTLGAALGALAVHLFRRRSGGDVATRAADHATIEELRGRVTALVEELSAARNALAEAQQRRVAAETRFGEAERHFAEQREMLAAAEKRLGETFEALAARALRTNNEQFVRQAAEQVKPLSDALKAYEARIHDVEKSLKSDYGGLKEQITALGAAHRELTQSTHTLSTALRAPQVKGRWGEITLRRAVEAAGLNPHCDFTEQAETDNEENRQRPDLVVHLPGERSIVVDAKAPTSAYLDAIEADSETARGAALSAHARAIRQHMLALSHKSYWKQFQATPEFVVMFVPGEAFFSAALEQNRELIEEGIRNQVILASPTTLIALLQGVAYSWRQQDMVRHAQEIGETARDLFERICRFADHFSRIGDSLRRSTDAYNEAVGSWQRRVLPAGRRIAELGVRVKNEQAADLQQVEVEPRELPESYVKTLSPKPEQASLGFDP